MSNNDVEEAVTVAASVVEQAAKAPEVQSSIQPEDRDVILGEGSVGHKTNFFLQDVMRLHRILWKLQEKAPPEKVEDLTDLVEHIHTLIVEGKPYELGGLKDVPKPFLKTKGRFIQKKDDVWNIVEAKQVKDELAKALFEEFKIDDLGNLDASPFKELKEMLNRKFPEGEHEDDGTMPTPKDVVLFMSAFDGAAEKMYENQGGNKNVFTLASQLVTTSTSNTEKRVEAAIAVLKELDEAELRDEEKEKLANLPTEAKKPQYLVRMLKNEDSVVWKILQFDVIVEFAVVFVFEVFLEKDIHLLGTAAGVTNSVTEEDGEDGEGVEGVKPSVLPIEDPTDYDVLFGRGGMTNSHPGNRRFRDVIALHRPDYIRAIKMDKPGVARKIVKAIRLGTPPGRFMKKRDDGKWYEVGDRTAAEKTSQGLRERSNAEKRQRSALREALRIRKQDMEEDETEDDESPNKKAKASDPADNADAATKVPTLNYVGTNLASPLSLQMKEVKVSKKKDKDGKISLELNTEGLPPNAVDEEGNILVTDYDILCGRGGLTNHHKGNKRFRDIVALHRPDYVRAPKIQKPSVARVIVRAIRNGDPPGRFLRKDDKSGKWVDVGDKKAAEKTSQALREKTNEERDKIKRDTGLLGVQIMLPTPTTFLTSITGTPLLVPPDGVPTAVPEESKEAEAKTAEETQTNKEEAIPPVEGKDGKPSATDELKDLDIKLEEQQDEPESKEPEVQTECV